MLTAPGRLSMVAVLPLLRGGAAGQVHFFFDSVGIFRCGFKSVGLQLELVVVRTQSEQEQETR